MFGYQKVRWILATGKVCLVVGNVIVAVEGDPCRDSDIPRELLIDYFGNPCRYWTSEAIYWIVNRGY